MATVAAGDETAAGKAGFALPKGARYAVVLLALGNFLNYLDRHIVSILGNAMKKDLGLDDAQLGFLLGTAFAVFYSVVGIAMGGVADRLSRKKVMAAGLALWSAMTALGGLAVNFTTLALARIGVGIGEATAGPCALSMLADTFPPRNRSLVMGIYSSGAYLGNAGAMIVGGYLLQNWHDVCSVVPLAGACAVAPWKAALFAVGLPGLPLALLLLTIREPARERRRERGAVAVLLREFAATIPPFTLVNVGQLGGTPGIVRNLTIGLIVALVAGGLIAATGDTAQWASLGFGVYTIVTWGQIQSYRDRPLHRLTFGDPTFLLSTAGTAMIACAVGAVSAWAAPFAMRTYALKPAEVGLGLGVLQTVGAVTGVILGGWLTDKWKVRDRRAPLAMSAITLIGAVPCILTLLYVDSVRVFFLSFGLLSVVASLWGGGVTALIQDLVLPRMRGSAAACYSLVTIVVTFGMGPYWAGKVSALTGSLTTGMLSVLALGPLALLLLWLAGQRLRSATPEARRALAEAEGESAAATR